VNDKLRSFQLQLLISDQMLCLKPQFEGIRRFGVNDFVNVSCTR